MAARQLCWPPAILFYRCRLDLSFFSPPNLRDRLADRHQTLPHVRPDPDLQNSVRNLRGPSPEIWQPKTINLIRFTLVRKRRNIRPVF